MKETTYKTEIGGREVEVKLGKYCGQANGHCIVQCGDTVVMVNATMSKAPRPGMDFFPLSVDYEEKMYSVGKIPGGYKKREGRPSDQAILRSRLIDRPIRPLFPKGFYNDVTIIATPLSVDNDIAPEPLAMLGSSIALSISDIPFEGPTGAVKVGCVDGKFIVNPTVEQMEKSSIDLTVSGTKEAILMVESGAKEVSEELMLDAIMFAHEEIKKQVEFQEKMVKDLKVKKTDKIIFDEIPEDLDKAVREYADKKLDEILTNFDRHVRDDLEDEMTADVLAHFEQEYPEQEKAIGQILYNMKKEKVRHKILYKGIRPDGRKTNEIRPIWCEVGLLPRVHGSAVFTRGETQVLTTCTLGMISEAQELDGLDTEEYKRYMHQYNMPGYTTGEAKPLRSPGRREIGHGALAERALLAVLPSEEEFPYAIRTVSDVLSSNGSTSQASVCGSTLALMDAGVPISAPVAGIAMGLMKDKDSDRVAVLTDIQGLEDFLGDMDFKVAGTTKGITAIQMDIKIHGIDRKILSTALEQARLGRLEILKIMSKTIKAPRKELSKYAPKIITFKIDPDKIREVIGTGGKVINQIIDKTGVKIDIKDEGDVFVSSTDKEMMEKAKSMILAIATDFELNCEYEGVVNKITPFGAFVEVAPGKEGMIHISKLSKEHVDKVEDVVKVGDRVRVKTIKIDERGRVDMKLIEKLN
ncbi:MAG TPA: polyribonucleotide nucleotidyltransferase [Candidatus Onthoplasma faecigallinarum]|nr:polyribonucleotide nucleotidyltransferase [Candidatus Onthoplasma faecigallinarum]